MPLEHHKPVRAAAFTSKEEGLVTGSSDGTCRLWSLDGKEQWRVDFQAGVNSVKIPEFGTTVVVATDDGIFRALDRQSGREWVRVNAGAEPNQWAVSPDGRWLLVANSSRELKIWELASGSISGRYVYQGQGEIVAHAATSDVGLIALQLMPDSTIRILDTDSMSLRPPEFRPEELVVLGVTFDPSGTWLAALSYVDIRNAETLQVWDAQTGDEVDWLPAQGKMANVQISKEGKWLAASWPAFGNEMALMWDRHSQRVAVARDGTWIGGFLDSDHIALLRADGLPGIVDLRRISGWRNLGQVKSRSPDFLDPPQIKTSAKIYPGIWLPDKGVTEISSYDDTGNREVWRWQISGWVDQAWFVADRWLIFDSICGFDATVGVWDAQTHRAVALPEQAWVTQINDAAATLTTVTLSGQSHLFALADIEGLQAAPLGVQALRDPPPKPSDLPSAAGEIPAKPLWSDDARTVAAIHDARLVVYRYTAPGSFTPVLDLRGEEKPLGLSPTGRYFIVEGLTSLTVYDLLCARRVISIPMLRPRRQPWEESNLAFSFAESQALLAIAVSERQVRIFDLTKGEELLRLSPEQPVSKLWFSNAAHSVIAVTKNSVERYLWQVQDLLKAAENRVETPRLPSKERESISGSNNKE